MCDVDEDEVENEAEAYSLLARRPTIIAYGGLPVLSLNFRGSRFPVIRLKIDAHVCTALVSTSLSSTHLFLVIY